MSTTATKTIDDALLEARTIVNDASLPYRSADAVFIQYLNSALRSVYALRPDAFIGSLTQGVLTNVAIPTYSSADFQTINGIANPTPPAPATPFPVDDRQFFYPVVAYMAGRIELADDEFVDGGPQVANRAMALMSSFKQQLTGM
jgi:hypothetical protein